MLEDFEVFGFYFVFHFFFFCISLGLLQIISLLLHVVDGFGGDVYGYVLLN